MISGVVLFVDSVLTVLRDLVLCCSFHRYSALDQNTILSISVCADVPDAGS